MKVARTVWTLAKSERIARDEETYIDWLYLYNGDHRVSEYQGLGVSSSEYWYSAFVFEPESNAQFITGAAYFGSEETQSSNVERRVLIYGSSSNTEPQDLLWDNSDDPSTASGWVEAIIEDQVDYVDAQEYQYYWIVVESKSTDLMWNGIGTDSGPGSQEGGWYKLFSDGAWENLNPGWGVNWLIECQIKYSATGYN